MKFILRVFAFLEALYFKEIEKRKPYVHQVKLPERKHIATVGRTVEPDEKLKDVYAWMLWLRQEKNINFGMNKDNLLFSFDNPNWQEELHKLTA